MRVLIVGDGPLAKELESLAQEGGHNVTSYFLADAGPERQPDLGGIVEDLTAEAPEIAIEATIAEPVEKWDVVTELDRLLAPEVPILTAALNASATEVASWCHDPGRVIGFAALPPLGEATVVEFMPALQSNEASVAAARQFWQSVGREPVAIEDSAAGVFPRVICNLVNEAAFALMEGVATVEDIDLAMQLGTNYPRGPLQWADLISIEQVVGVLEALGNEFGPDQYRPAPLLRQYARAGRQFYQ